MKRFPKTGSKTDNAFRLLHKRGLMTSCEVMNHTGMQREAFRSIASTYSLISQNKQYSLPEHLTKYYNDMHEQPAPKYQGEITPARTYVKNSPMQGYAAKLKQAASMREGCGLREIYYRTSGVTGNPERFYQ